MKRTIGIFIFLSLTQIILSQEKNYPKMVFKTDAAKSEFTLFLAKNYCSNASSILSFAEKPKKYTHYIDGTSYFSQLISYSTEIHEMCHVANFDIGGFETHGFFISDEIKLKILKGPVYKSSELNKMVPLDQQKRIFRYITYIRGTTDGGIRIPFLSSVNEGIYGLLNEFTAYYQGTQAALEIYPYVKSSYAEKNYQFVVDYLQQQSSEVYAYYEFRLFFAWYLNYAEKKHPNVYKSCIENQDLKVAITLVDQLYRKTVEKYKETRQNLVDEINHSGKMKASIDQKGGIVIGEEFNSTTWGGPDEMINYLQSLMTEKYELSLNQLLISGLTLENYKTFSTK